MGIVLGDNHNHNDPPNNDHNDPAQTQQRGSKGRFTPTPISNGLREQFRALTRGQKWEIVADFLRMHPAFFTHISPPCASIAHYRKQLDDLKDDKYRTEKVLQWVVNGLQKRVVNGAPTGYHH